MGTWAQRAHGPMGPWAHGAHGPMSPGPLLWQMPREQVLRILETKHVRYTPCNKILIMFVGGNEGNNDEMLAAKRWTDNVAL